jgi:hypothetical protein
VQALSPEQIVGIWEKGHGASLPDIGMLLLTAAFPAASVGEVLSLTLGQRDACLLRLRERTIGPRMECLTECPACGAQVEAEIQCSDILFADFETPVVLKHTLEEGEFRIEFRPLTSVDLLAIRGYSDVGSARALLVRRAVSAAWRNGIPVAATNLPADLIEKTGDVLSERDPQCEVRLRQVCPQCEHAWTSLFDIVSFFWRELSVRAERLLSEVQQIAKAYGWSEREIMSMSPVKRQFYLEAIG